MNATVTATAHPYTASPADIILQQLVGRNRLSAMINAKDFFSHGPNNNILKFKHMTSAASCPAGGATITEIEYDQATDLYNVRILKAGRFNRKDYTITPPVVKYETRGIYAEDLAKVWERATGLYVSIGTARRG